MKQNVNHSLRSLGLATFFHGKQLVSSYHRLKTWAEMLPQFWHWTVTFSNPFNGDLKTEGTTMVRIPVSFAEQEYTNRECRM
jgi:hypothetical protein